MQGLARMSRAVQVQGLIGRRKCWDDALDESWRADVRVWGLGRRVQGAGCGVQGCWHGD